ncbi:MAG: hypothetical protein ACYDH9_14570 [Limisphaerales bacterium]
MKWFSAICSFALVAAGGFFLAGWFLLPHAAEPPTPEHPLSILATVDWWHNGWGLLIGLLAGAASAWSILRKKTTVSTED